MTDLMQRAFCGLLFISTFLLLFAGCEGDSPTKQDDNGSSGNGKIYATRINASVPELLSINVDGTDMKVVRPLAGIISPPQAGKMLIATDSAQLLLADLDGNVIRTIPTVRIPTIAVLSPDASKICYAHRDHIGPNQAYAIRVVNADGTGDILITNQGGYENTVAFSPDSRRIAFYSEEEAGTQDKLYTAKTDGTDVRLVTDNAHSMNDRYGTVAWSPDGNRILCQRVKDISLDDNPQIWSIAIDGSDARELTDLTVPEGIFPRYSPDGSMIAFIGIDRSSPDEVGSELWVMNSDGSNKRRLTDTPGPDDIEVYPEWSPDGTSILYVSFDIPDQGDPVTGTLKSIDVATGSVRTLIATPDVFSAYWGRK